MQCDTTVGDIVLAELLCMLSDRTATGFIDGNSNSNSTE